MWRLQKIMARAGLASRRKSEDFILQGRVTVNGKVVDRVGTRADPVRDEVRVDGVLLRPERTEYYIVNKPRGVLSAVSDPRGRPVSKLVRPPGSGWSPTAGPLSSRGLSVASEGRSGRYGQPGAVLPAEGVGQDDELAHDGDEGHLAGMPRLLSLRYTSAMSGFQRRADRRHVQVRRARARPPRMKARPCQAPDSRGTAANPARLAGPCR